MGLTQCAGVFEYDARPFGVSKKMQINCTTGAKNIRRHASPNGREALYIASHAFKIDGLDQAPSATLIDEFTAFVTQDRYVYRHKWRVGDMLIWDQRAVLHRATPWDYDEPRKLSSLCVSMSAEDGLDAMRRSV